jgi:murein L,D-transpeptidase YcbB/YkuD
MVSEMRFFITVGFFVGGVLSAAAGQNPASDSVSPGIPQPRGLPPAGLQSPAPARVSTPSGQPPAANPASAPASVIPAVKSVPSPVTLSQDPRPTLGRSTFIDTVRAAGTYKRIAESGGWPTLPAETVLKSGDRGGAVLTLRRRLAAEGDLAGDGTGSDVFDEELVSAVRRFQVRHGLAESGAVRARTIQALNVPASIRHRQLAASAQRLMNSTFPFGERYVIVNIPSAAVEAIEGGRVVRRYVAVVGKADRASPMVETRITAINLNPTWTVPVSLIRKDIIPHVREDPAYLSRMNIRVLDAKGQEVNPQSLDWSTEQATNHTLRQDPGAINSLGQIRIDMPNKHAVYMHDTPTKRLFAQDLRFYSSGCVRVADIHRFAAWLLAETPRAGGSWTRADLETAIATPERQDIRLEKPVPVAWIYLTGYATPDGVVHFRDDVYGLDTPTDRSSEPQEIDVPATSSIPVKRT